MTKCPKCGHPHFLGETRCLSCGIVFLAWLEAKAKAPKPLPPPPPKPKPKRHVLGWSAAILAAAGVSAWLGLLPPSSMPLPDKARADAEHKLAFVPPYGWKLEPSVRTTGPVVEAARLSAEGALIQVLIGPAALASSGGAELVASEFQGSGWRLDSSDEVDVDRLQAVRLRVSGGFGVMKLDDDPWMPPPGQLKGTLVVLPGSGRSYLIKLLSANGDAERFEKPFSEFLASFRAHDRPLRVENLRWVLLPPGLVLALWALILLLV